MATFYNQATLTYNNTTVSSNIVSGEITEALTAAKTAVSDSYSAGGTITYAVSLVNTGSTELTGITLTDDLGAYEAEGTSYTPLTYEDGSAELFVNGVLQPAPAAVTTSPLVFSDIVIPAGGNAVIIYQAAANEFAPPDTGSVITNTVTAAAGGNTVTATATVPVEDEAVLSISKSLSPTEVTGNSPITYGFMIQNTGNTAESAAVITDTFDPVLTDITVTFNSEKAAATGYTYDEQTGVFATTAGAFTVPAATFTRDPVTGAYATVPGTAYITVTGTL
ncbi:MAG: hypothetical protein IJT87_02715 [Ruminiclostridium sp.]|nr:hypothetical protein [Ruminiclostridium sp.]